MTRSRVFLVLQTIICIALTVWLCVSAVGICQEGAARKSEQPMESVYTPKIAAEKAAPILPLFFAGLGLTIAGLVLGIKDTKAEKPVRDAELERDLLVSRVTRPSEGMLKERQRQKGLKWVGWGLFALCMAPVLVYMFDPRHFPEADLEGMFLSLMRVLLPWTLVGLGALAVASILTEKSVRREMREANLRIREDSAQGIQPAQAPSDPPKKTARLQILLLAAAFAFIIAGVLNGSALDVLIKAITICTECVGLG